MMEALAALREFGAGRYLLPRVQAHQMGQEVIGDDARRSADLRVLHRWEGDRPDLT